MDILKNAFGGKSEKAQVTMTKVMPKIVLETC